MEDPLNRNLPAKAWSPLYIGIISFFCFILPGVILMGLNYEKLGRSDLKKRTWLVGSIGFVILFVLFLLLPPQYDWLTTALHIGTAFVIAAIPYPLFVKARENNPNWKTQPILKPALISLLFVIIPVLGIIFRNEYLLKKELRLLKISKEFFDQKEYHKAIGTLKLVREINPQQQLSYINAAIAYEATGERDSAKLILKEWLEIAPDDFEARELLAKLR